MKHKGECSVFITETVSDLLKNYTPALHKYCPQFINVFFSNYPVIVPYSGIW